MGFFSKLFTTAALASVAVGGYIAYKNRDEIRKRIKARKQNISLDLEVLNQAHHDLQEALDAQFDLEEQLSYARECSEKYTVLKESYVRVQHEIHSAKANEEYEKVAELEKLKDSIKSELRDGLAEFETSTTELNAHEETLNKLVKEVEEKQKLYQSAKQTVLAHGRKYLNDIVDPVKKTVEQTFQTIEFKDELPSVEEVVEETSEVVSEVSETTKSSFETAVDKTHDSISRLLNTINNRVEEETDGQ